MERTSPPAKWHWRPALFGTVLAIGGIALLGWNLKWIGNVASGPAEVGQQQLRTIQDPDDLDNAWVSFAPSRIVDTGVTKSSGTRKSHQEYKFLLLNVEDRWLIAGVPVDFQGQQVTGYLTIWKSPWGADAIEQVRSAIGDRRDQLLPYQMEATKPQVLECLSLVGIALFLIAGGAFLVFFSEEGSELAVERFVQRVWSKAKTPTGEGTTKPSTETPAPEVAPLGEPLSTHPPVRPQEIHPVLGLALILGLVGGFLMLVPTVVALGMHNGGEKPSDANFYLALMGLGRLRLAADDFRRRSLVLAIVTARQGSAHAAQPGADHLLCL